MKEAITSSFFRYDQQKIAGSTPDYSPITTVAMPVTTDDPQYS